MAMSGEDREPLRSLGCGKFEGSEHARRKAQQMRPLPTVREAPFHPFRSLATAVASTGLGRTHLTMTGLTFVAPCAPRVTTTHL